MPRPTRNASFFENTWHFGHCLVAWWLTVYNKQRRKWWAEERRKVEGGVITHKDVLTKPHYASMAADFMRSTSTGLIGQFQALDEDQQQGFTRVCGQKEGHGLDERAPAM